MKRFSTVLLFVIYCMNAYSNIWTQIASGPSCGYGGVGFAIGNKGYWFTGSLQENYFFEYDPATNQWTAKNRPPEREPNNCWGATAFAIGNKGYLLQNFNKKFYEYDPALDRWTEKTSIPAIQGLFSVSNCQSFVINGKGYIAGGIFYYSGSNYFYSKRTFEYDPILDTWNEKANMPYGVGWGTSFELNWKGYVATGIWDSINYFPYFMEYDPTLDVWNTKEPFSLPGQSDFRNIGFSLGNVGFIVGGYHKRSKIYNPNTDEWIYISPLSSNMVPPSNLEDGIAFCIGNKCYIGGGNNCSTNAEFYSIDVNDFISSCNAQFTLHRDVNVPGLWYALNQGTGLSLTYLWDWGDGTTSTGPYPSHTYSSAGYYNICLSITDATGCTDTYCDSSTYIYKNENAVITINVLKDLPTGIKENLIEEIKFELFPNPTSDYLYYSIDKDFIKAISIYNSLGSLLLSTNKIYTNIIDIREFQAGIYYAEIRTADKIIMKKFVKK